MRIADLIQEAYTTSVSKGWHERPLVVDGKPDPDRIGAKLALIHSEIVEAEQAWLDGYEAMTVIDGKPEGMVTELADVVIRVCDLCGALGLRLDGYAEPLLDPSSLEYDDVLEHLLALHKHTSRGLECVRLDKLHFVKHEDDSLTEHLADLIGECKSLCDDLDLDLIGAIETKMAYNKTRTHRHGGKTL